MFSNFFHFHFVFTVQKSKATFIWNVHVLFLYCVPGTLHWHRPTDRSIDRRKQHKKRITTIRLLFKLHGWGQEPGQFKYFSIVNREEKRFIDDNTWLFKVIIAMRWRAYCFYFGFFPADAASASQLLAKEHSISQQVIYEVKNYVTKLKHR